MNYRIEISGEKVCVRICVCMPNGGKEERLTDESKRETRVTSNNKGRCFLFKTLMGKEANETAKGMFNLSVCACVE